MTKSNRVRSFNSEQNWSDLVWIWTCDTLNKEEDPKHWASQLSYNNVNINLHFFHCWPILFSDSHAQGGAGRVADPTAAACVPIHQTLPADERSHLPRRLLISTSLRQESAALQARTARVWELRLMWYAHHTSVRVLSRGYNSGSHSIVYLNLRY